jgi:hypothetical protein
MAKAKADTSQNGGKAVSEAVKQDVNTPGRGRTMVQTMKQREAKAKAGRKTGGGEVHNMTIDRTAPEKGGKAEPGQAVNEADQTELSRGERGEGNRSTQKTASPSSVIEATPGRSPVGSRVTWTTAQTR